MSECARKHSASPLKPIIRHEVEQTLFVGFSHHVGARNQRYIHVLNYERLAVHGSIILKKARDHIWETQLTLGDKNGVVMKNSHLDHFCFETCLTLRIEPLS